MKFSNIFQEIFQFSSLRLSGSIIDEAVKKFEENSSDLTEENQGILFKLLQKDKKYAIVMAFDLIFGGVDTVKDF